MLSLPTVRIRAQLGRADTTGRVAVRLEGRRASTVVQPLAESSERALEWLVGIRLETGLRHQARVHLAWIGRPIVGDVDYGGEAAGEQVASAIRLHALVLDLSAVFPTEQTMVAPPEPDFWP